MTTRRNHARTLTVMVEGWIIEDGRLPPPRVGGVLSTHLMFRQCPEPAHDDPGRQTLRAGAHPDLGREPLRRSPGEWLWRTILRGDGWSALWPADRPSIGHVELTGNLEVDFEACADEVRGRVTRVRLVTTGFRRTGEEDPEHPLHWAVVPGSARYVDVETAPGFFDRGDLDAPDPERREQQIGVLVDLDLDGVPPANLRPRIRPSSISAHGSTLWILDRELPVLVQLDTRTRQLSEQVLPAPVVTPHSRRVIADSAGCWVAGSDGVFRCTFATDGPLVVRKLDSRPASMEAALRGTLLAVSRREPSARLLRSDGESTVVTLPTGTVRAVTAAQGGFCLLLDQSPPVAPGSGCRIVVVAPTTGAVQVGPAFTTGDRLGPVGFASSDPLCILAEGAIHQVRDDLTITPLGPVPRTTWLAGDQPGDRIRLVTHRSDGWLLAELDTATLRLHRILPLSHSAPHVAETADGTVWIAGDGLWAAGLDGAVRSVGLAGFSATAARS